MYLPLQRMYVHKNITHLSLTAISKLTEVTRESAVCNDDKPNNEHQCVRHDAKIRCRALICQIIYSQTAW